MPQHRHRQAYSQNIRDRGQSRENHRFELESDALSIWDTRVPGRPDRRALEYRGNYNHPGVDEDEAAEGVEGDVEGARGKGAAVE